LDFWLLYYDNVPVRASLLVHEFSAKNKIKTMPQLPYLPDMASCNFSIAKNKENLKGPLFYKHR